jgi:ABC-type Zn uptake system ZnuABC Zn-binding protein ZnuA
MMKMLAWMACLGAGLLALPGCDGGAPPRQGPAAAATAPAAGRAKPLVVVSVYPVASIVDQLVGDWADVYTLIPPASSADVSRLGDISRGKLAKADVLLTVSPEFDGWIEAEARAVARKDIKLLRCSDIVGLTRGGVATPPATAPTDAPAAGHAGGYLWLDPLLTDHLIDRLGERLAPLAPEHASSLLTRDKLLRTNLLLLHNEFAAKLHDAPNHRLVMYRGTFDALAKRYGLEVVAHFVEPGAGETVSPEHLAEVIAAVQRYRLPVTYAEAYRDDRPANAVARHTGGRVLVLDPIGGPERDGYRTYLEMMRSNLELLAYGQSRPALEDASR